MWQSGWGRDRSEAKQNIVICPTGKMSWTDVTPWGYSRQQICLACLAYNMQEEKILTPSDRLPLPLTICHNVWRDKGDNYDNQSWYWQQWWQHAVYRGCLAPYDVCYSDIHCMCLLILQRSIWLWHLSSVDTSGLAQSSGTWVHQYTAHM